MSLAAFAPLIGAGIGLAGNIMGANAASEGSDAARYAGKKNVELNRNQALINSQLMNPFIGTGYGALYDLYGYQQVPTGGTAGYARPDQGGNAFVGGDAGDGNIFNVPTLNQRGTGWRADTYVGDTGYAKTGQPFDPTGGSGQYMDALEGYGSNWEFDPTDPVYQYKMQEMEKLLNRQAATSGLQGSSALLNNVANAGQSIMAEEFDKQYGRGYSNLVDLYNMGLQQGNIGYNALLDAVKIGTGAGATAGGLGNQAAGNLSSAYTGMANNAFMQGQQNQQAWQDAAGTVMGGINNYLLYDIMKNRQPQSQPTGMPYIF